MIDSDWLVAFRALAEQRTFAAAAKKLHLSQPAVHQQVKRLADVAGVPLYERVGRGIVLTAQGIELAAFARDQEERTAALLARLRGERERAPITLAAGAGALLYVLGEGLRRYVKGKPERVDVVTADAPTTLELVRRGSAHVGVAVLSAPAPGLTCQRVTDVEQVAVMFGTDRLARKRTVGLADLAGRKLIVPPEGRPHRAMIDAAFAARDMAWETGAQVVGWELMVRMVLIGAGTAIVNGTCAIPKPLVARPVRELPKVRYYVFSRTDTPPEAERLRQVLATHGEAWRTGKG